MVGNGVEGGPRACLVFSGGVRTPGMETCGPLRTLGVLVFFAVRDDLCCACHFAVRGSGTRAVILVAGADGSCTSNSIGSP